MSAASLPAVPTLKGGVARRFLLSLLNLSALSNKQARTAVISKKNNKMNTLKGLRDCQKTEEGSPASPQCLGAAHGTGVGTGF